MNFFYFLFLLLINLHKSISYSIARQHRQTADNSRIQNLRTFFDAKFDSLIVEWDPIPNKEIYDYLIRYKILTFDVSSSEENNYSQWQQKRSTEPKTQIRVNHLNNDNELIIQVKMEGIEWSDALRVAISKRSSNDQVVDEGNLLPPLNFRANIFGPNKVQLEWNKSKNPIGDGAELYYIVNIRQLTINSGGSPLIQEIKVKGDNFIMDHLTAGELYEITIRSAKNPDNVSSAAAILEISMPKTDEYYEVGNLIVTSRFKGDGTGTVNLTWEVPEKLIGKIRAYDVRYSSTNKHGNEPWKQIHFSGDNPSAILNDLKSDTEYLLKIKTFLHKDNLEVESGEFKFRTPKVGINPINKVDVIYSSETNAVRLQWSFQPDVSIDNIKGYDLYLSQDIRQPLVNWRLIRSDTPEPELSIEDLQTSTTYFAKINVRNKDGTILDAPSLYRFTTIDRIQKHYESNLPDPSAYKNVGSGRMKFTWAYPPNIRNSVIGATIFYTDQVNNHVDKWQKLRVHNSEQQSIMLVGLRPNTLYHVQVVPMLQNEKLDFNLVERFQLRTDSFQ